MTTYSRTGNLMRPLILALCLMASSAYGQVPPPTPAPVPAPVTPKASLKGPATVALGSRISLDPSGTISAVKPKFRLLSAPVQLAVKPLYDDAGALDSVIADPVSPGTYVFVAIAENPEVPPPLDFAFSTASVVVTDSPIPPLPPSPIPGPTPPGPLPNPGPAPTPTPQTPFALSFVNRVRSQPDDFVAVGNMIREGKLKTRNDVVNELLSRGKPMSDATTAVIAPRVNAAGLLTDPTGLAAEFIGAGTAAGGK